MFSESSAWNRPRIPATSAMVSAFSIALLATAGYAPLALAADVKPSVSSTSARSGASQNESIRPFRVHVPDAQLADLRKRIAATQWPDKETVNDTSQVSSWRMCRRWCSTGAMDTTGARQKRS